MCVTIDEILLAGLSRVQREIRVRGPFRKNTEIDVCNYMGSMLVVQPTFRGLPYSLWAGGTRGVARRIYMQNEPGEAEAQ